MSGRHSKEQGDVVLFIFGGLPATGKSELAADLARRAGAAYLRIDTIEQTMRNQAQKIAGPEGYIVAYRLAADNLRLGISVVADSVNPIELTRAAWRDVAAREQASFCEIEVICTDGAEHRRRVESRGTTVPGLRPPTWEDVVNRDYRPWENGQVVIDTAGQTPAECKTALVEALRARGIRW